MRTPKFLTRFLAVGIGLVTTAALSIAPSSASEPADSPYAKPTIVLVHGAFAGGDSWIKVIEKLQRRGYPVVAAANPLRSVAGDAAAVRSAKPCGKSRSPAAAPTSTSARSSSRSSLPPTSRSRRRSCSRQASARSR